MINSQIVFAVISLAAGGGSAVAADPAWYPIGYEAAVDLSSVRKIGHISRVWTMDILMETDSNGIDYSLRRYEIDCNDRTFLQMSYSAYDIDGVVKSTGDNRTEKFSVPPGTVISAIADVACDDEYDADFPPIDDAGAFVEIARRLALSDVSRR